VTPIVGLSAFDLSVSANPREALAARRGIFVRRRFSAEGRTVRAAGSHRRVARLLTVVAFTPTYRRGMVAPFRVLPAAADLLRPSAEEA
jgi:hypothetical protein